jgi:hypothetical protein
VKTLDLRKDVLKTMTPGQLRLVLDYVKAQQKKIGDEMERRGCCRGCGFERDRANGYCVAGCDANAR